MDIRFFTPEEARARLAEVKPLLADLREAFHEYKFAKDQLADLREQYHEDVFSAAFPHRDEAVAWRDREAAAAVRVQALLDRLNTLGADVKDPLLGLVDFYARRPTGEVVLLCWRDDEETLGWWHPLDTGFAGRRPLSEF